MGGEDGEVKDKMGIMEMMVLWSKANLASM